MRTILSFFNPLALIISHPELPPSKWYPLNPPVCWNQQCSSDIHLRSDWYRSDSCLPDHLSLYTIQIAFVHNILKDLYPTGHSWCQSRVTPYRCDNSWRHSTTWARENIAMCICIESTHHHDYDNTGGWVVMMWSRNLCLAVISVLIVLA